MKKLVSGILALGLAVTTVVSAVASAAGSFINGKDPNGEGYLSLADSTYIQLVLSGKYRPSDLTQLDVDDNCVVSNADVYMTQLKELGYYNNVSETEDVTSPMNVAAVTSTSRSYNAYKVAENGVINYNTLRQYSLSVENDDNSIDTHSIIDTDDRIPLWSNQGTTKIITSTGFGSGFVVGKHTIATAAHVIYKKSFLSKVLVFNQNGTPTKLTPKEIHIPTQYTGDKISQYDYALITVEENLTEYNSFNLGLTTDLAGNHNLTVAVTGFPQKVKVDDNLEVVNTSSKHQEYLGIGLLTDADASWLYYDADTYGGNSGGPVYTTEVINGNTYYTVVAIHTNEGNCGIRLTPDVLKFLKGNTNIQY